jgi:flavin-dependent dehydrogenase
MIVPPLPQPPAVECQRWDAIVLGAGPAGALAARQLALAKLRVLLVEKAKLPRFKVCGGCLGAAALEVLDRVGLGHVPSDCRGVPLEMMELANAGAVARIAMGRHVAVCREEFDGRLVEAAAQAGAVVCDETEGKLTATQRSPAARSVQLRRQGIQTALEARVVVVATGLAASAPPFETTFSPRAMIGLGAIVRDDRQDCRHNVLQMGCSAIGYVGVAPLAGGQLDVAAAVRPRALAVSGLPARLIDRMLREAGLPAPSRLELESASWRGTPPLTRTTRPLAAHRCLLVGDAAGYVEPFTGEGIGWALESALLASQLVLEGIDAWDATLPQRWRRMYAEALAAHHRRCRIITRLLRHGAIRRVALWGLQRVPSLATPVVKRIQQPIG